VGSIDIKSMKKFIAYLSEISAHAFFKIDQKLKVDLHWRLQRYCFKMV